MKTVALRLTRFDAFEDAAAATATEESAPEALGEALEAARAEADAAGYARGRAEAEAEIHAGLRAAIAALSESARDLELAQAAMRSDEADRIRPVIEAVASAVAPRAAALGLAGGVAEAAVERIAYAPGLALSAHCAPEAVEALRDALDGAITVTADPALSAGAARLAWEGGGATYDADACAAAALRAVEAFFDAASGEAATPYSAEQPDEDAPRNDAPSDEMAAHAVEAVLPEAPASADDDDQPAQLAEFPDRASDDAASPVETAEAAFDDSAATDETDETVEAAASPPEPTIEEAPPPPPPIDDIEELFAHPVKRSDEATRPMAQDAPSEARNAINEEPVDDGQ